MGIQKSGILGPFRNKVGPVIGRRHKGQDLMVPLPRVSDKPPTEKQLEAQLLFGLLNSFIARIDKLINIGFKAYVKRNTPANAAYTYNYDHAFIKHGDVFLLNYPKFVYSRGHVVTPEGAQITSAEGKVAFRWQPQKQSAYCQFSDLASFLIYNPAKEMAVISQGNVNRYAQTFTIDLPTDYPDDVVHCYMSFAAANGKLQGDSLYVGEITIQ